MIRTIIVDDEILSRIGLQSFIDGKEGIAVSGVFGEAQEAIEFLEKNPVDVVLTDIEMTDINGLEFIQYIREKNLAGGVIIVSCHDDFSYAQQAISLNIDSYILKHSVTEEMLIREVKKAYEKAADRKAERRQPVPERRRFQEIRQDSIYRIGILKLNSWEMPITESKDGQRRSGMRDTRRESAASHLSDWGEQQLEGDMLVHLLDGIVKRYRMGTLFAPYNREIFILFQMEKGQDKTKREEMTADWVGELQKNMQQYINGTLICGLSEEFEALTETRSGYDHAVQAAEQFFYHPEQAVFYYRTEKRVYNPDAFLADGFLRPEWILGFERELEERLLQAEQMHVPVSVLKETLIQSMNRLVYQIDDKYRAADNPEQKRNGELALISAVTAARTSAELRQVLLVQMKEFHESVRLESEKDELTEVLRYIDQHLEEKITLPELAEIGCMSIPSFSKKFKDRTGMTLVQYLNEKRIERAKVLLRQKKYTLMEIAEMTGFSNANYLLRVFKKSTGKTISEYRRQFGITE